MCKLFFSLIIFWSASSLANECYLDYKESALIGSVGNTPKYESVKKEDGVLQKQFKFREEPTAEEAFADDSESKYDPQFYITIYDPQCPKKVRIWFYGGGNGIHEGNVDLASKAWAYLTGQEPTVFKNKLRKFSDVQKFESHDEKASTLFIKAGDMHIADVYLK